MTTSLYAAIELGGTKVICLVGDGLDNIVAECVIQTGEPESTLSAVADFLFGYKPFASIGIGSFGPIDVNPLSSQFGCIQSTPKKGWGQCNLYRYFSEKFQCPVFIDTDVNAAALGEFHLGAAKDLSNFIYITVGTGIGGGALIRGRSVQGLSHPEMGHISLPRAKGDEHFEGCCPFHSDCAEGFASGPAIFKRWGSALNQLPENGPAWDMQAYYLAELSHTLTLLYAPQKIIFGGGVASEALLVKTREKLLKRLNGYVHHLSDISVLQDYLSLPALGNKAGPYGSFLLNFHH